MPDVHDRSIPYFERTGVSAFVSTSLVGGAWNRTEQHIAPVLGLIAHAIEKDLRTRRDDDLELGRLSFGILGTIPIGTVTIEVTVIRPGRTTSWSKPDCFTMGARQFSRAPG